MALKLINMSPSFVLRKVFKLNLDARRDFFERILYEKDVASRFSALDEHI